MSDTTLYGLNNALFAQLERLNTSELTGTNLAEEVERAKAVSMISRDIICNARLVLEADQHKAEYGAMRSYPVMLEVPKK